MQHLPTEEDRRPTHGIDHWPMGKLNREHRAEADRERDGWYKSREEFAAWVKAMGAKYGVDDR